MFPSSNGTKQDNLAFAWETARNVAGQIKGRSQSLRNSAEAGAIPTDMILDYVRFLGACKTTLQRAAFTQGIAAYAQEQIADNTINVATEFNNMMSALDAVGGWIFTNFPKDVDGWLLSRKFNPDNSGRTDDRLFSPAQTAGLRTVLDALIATID